MSETDTPRTDAACGNDSREHRSKELPDLCRKLERELAEARTVPCGIGTMSVGCWLDIIKERDALKSEVERLTKAITKQYDRLRHHHHRGSLLRRSLTGLLEQEDWTWREKR
jgi:hypothetical protein